MMRELVIKFNSIPKFTKIYLVFIVFNSFIYALSRTLKSHYLWFFIELQLLSINKLKNFQIWRFFTNFFFTRHLNFTLPLHLILIIKTFSSLENFYKNKKSYKDFYLMLVFNIMVLNIVGLILENEIMSEEFLISILFMEAHTDPERERNLFGMHIKAKHFPYAFIMLNLASGGDIVSDIVGIFSGYIYCYLSDKNYLNTRLFFKSQQPEKILKEKKSKGYENTSNFGEMNLELNKSLKSRTDSITKEISEHEFKPPENVLKWE